MLNHAPPRGHAERPERLQAVLDGIAHIEASRREAPFASRDAIARVHPGRYIDALEGAFAETRDDQMVQLDPDTYLSAASREACYRGAGAVTAAVDAVMSGEDDIAFCAVRPPGHHAAPRTTPPASAPASQPASGGRASSPSSAAPSATSSPSAAVPAGYYRFTNSTGFSIGVPRGWQISHDGHYVYIRDPANSGIFLLIDQSDQPKANALADWRQQAANRQGTYPGYHLILLQPVRYPQAEQAADWEFTYNRNGVTVQVLNRNILANARHAYALYWSTPASDWNAYYHFFQVFAATFRPAPAGQPG